MKQWQSRHAGWVVAIVLASVTVLGTWLVEAGHPFLAFGAMAMALVVAGFALVLIAMEDL